MSKPRATKSTFIPAPIDGLNLISPPTQLRPTEARELENFYVFDWGIRQVKSQSLVVSQSAAVGSIFPVYPTLANDSFLIQFKPTKIEKVALLGLTGTDKTGGLTITNNNWQMHQFKNYVFCYNGADDPIAYNLSADTAGLAGWTGPGDVADLIAGWNYKHREYAIEKDTATYWYGGVDAITGAMESVDVSTILHDAGDLLFGTSWSFNQGLTNEELFVLVSTTGEILIYSGDFPTAPNWRIISRVTIPEPVGKKAFRRLGQDVLIGTKRGVISLRQVFAGRVNPDYFLISRKLGPIEIADKEFAISFGFPFMYIADVNDVIWVLNYERGAWSSLSAKSELGALAWAEETLSGARLIYSAEFGGSGASDYLWGHNDESDDSASGEAFKWHTPYFDFGSNLQKNAMQIRLLGKLLKNNTGSFHGKVGISNDFATAPGSTDSGSVEPTADEYKTVELAAPGVGRRLSYEFERLDVLIGGDSVVEYNGFEAFYEEGGVY